MAVAKKAAMENLHISIPEIKNENASLTVYGDSSLIMHKWSVKAKRQILEKQTKKASKVKEKKNPIRDYVESMYWIDEKGNEIAPPEVKDYETEEDGAEEYERIQQIAEKSHFGFPACAFKACALDAAYQQGIITKKTTARGAFHINGDLVEIEGVPNMREDMVKVGGMTKVADIRYRGEFQTWKATLNISYNPDVISLSQIASMLAMGGFSNGVGEWRPSRNGEHGRFRIAEN